MMSQIAKQCIRIGTIVLASALLFALLLVLRSKSPSQAAHLEPIASSFSVNKDILPESGAYHGAVIPLEQIDAFECMVGKKLKVIKVYQHFHNGDFYENFADSIHERGAIEFLSFDPTVETGDLNCCEVLSGDYDSIVITFAQHIKSWGQPLILSFAGEMNGNWAGWSGAYNFGSDCTTYTQVADLYASYGCTDTERIECADGPERYRDVYRHIHDIFATEGVTNVVWAWVINHESIPDEEWNQANNYYPGDSYVDIISVDGYNWGNDGPGGWKTFNQVFSATLTSLSSSYPTKPFMLGEFASVEGTDPMSKANWITDAYSHVKLDWPQIKAVLWFNISGDWDFPVESSPESVRAYREAIADPCFIGDPVWCSYLPLVCKSYPPTPFCTDSGSGGTETIKVEPPRTLGGIRIDLIKRRVFPDGKRYGFSLWEVEIYGPGTNNLAIGATATASSSQDSYGCYECFPYKAIDGNTNTRWASDWSEPQWLAITLPASQVVDRVVLKWEAAYAKEYCVTTTTPMSFQNFEPDNGTPPGGGNYFWDAWFTTCSFESAVVREGSRAVRVDAHAAAEGNPGDHGGTMGINPSSSDPIDLSSATTLSVWVYDTQGDNTVELKLRDYNDALSNNVWSEMQAEQNKWTEITWSLSDFTDVDLSQIKNIELYEWNDGIYFIDAVSYQ